MPTLPQTLVNGRADESSALPITPPVVETSIFNAKTVIQTLESLMTRVTAEECTPSTVNAACNCAARISEFLRLHLEVERLRRKKE